MTDKIHEYAQQTTPKGVNVGTDLTSLFTWAVGKFGGIVFATGIACYAAVTVYDDSRKQNDKWLDAFNKQTVATYYMADALNSMAKSSGLSNPDLSKLYTH